MEFQQDFSSSRELKHPLFEVFSIGFMALAWAVFILSTKNYQNAYWYEWLYFSRVGMALLGVSLIGLIITKKLYHYNIASWYLLASVGVQASHGYFEGENSVDFYNFIGIIFVLSCLSYTGSLKNWAQKYLPFQVLFFVVPLLSKNERFLSSPGTFIDSFSLMVSGLIIGLGILKISSSRYLFIIKYLESKQELVRLASQVAHDIRSPVTSLRVALEDVECEEPEKQIINFSLTRIEDIANDLLQKYKKSNTSSRTFIEDLENLISEKKLINKRSIKFDITCNPEHKDLKFLQSSANLNRVVSNLLNNSLESIERDSGLIEIKFLNEGPKYVLSITDNGKGIPSNVLNQFKGKSFSFNKAKGTGLGLNHAKEFIKGLKGELRIDSQVNTGTSVQLIFPANSFGTGLL